VRRAGLLLQHLRIEQHPLGTGQALAHAQRELVLGRGAALVEEQVPGAALHPGHPGRGAGVDLLELAAQGGAPADASQRGMGVLAVRLHPRSHLGRLALLEIAVGVVDRRVKEGLAHVAHRRHRQAGRL
jgi:hypothetical protein